MFNHPHFDASGIPDISGGVTNPANRGKAITSFLIRCIRLYQKLISPLLGPRCRFYPSCSQYAIESFERRGLWSGSIQTIKRLGRCQPWHPGGVDLP